MTTIDAAAVMRHHTACKVGHSQPYCFGCGHQAVHPCEPYQLAEALQTEQARTARVAHVLNEDNRNDQRYSVAALGVHVPKVQGFITRLWQALGEARPTNPPAHSSTPHDRTDGGGAR